MIECEAIFEKVLENISFEYKELEIIVFIGLFDNLKSFLEKQKKIVLAIPNTNEVLRRMKISYLNRGLDF